MSGAALSLPIPARLAGFRCAKRFDAYRRALESHSRKRMEDLLRYTASVQKRADADVLDMLPMTMRGMLEFLSNVPTSDANLEVFMRYCEPLPLAGFVSPRARRWASAEKVLHRMVLRSMSSKAYRFLLAAPKGVDRLILSMLFEENLVRKKRKRSQ